MATNWKSFYPDNSTQKVMTLNEVINPNNNKPHDVDVQYWQEGERKKFTDLVELLDPDAYYLFDANGQHIYVGSAEEIYEHVYFVVEEDEYKIADPQRVRFTHFGHALTEQHMREDLSSTNVVVNPLCLKAINDDHVKEIKEYDSIQEDIEKALEEKKKKLDPVEKDQLDKSYAQRKADDSVGGDTDDDITNDLSLIHI